MYREEALMKSIAAAKKEALIKSKSDRPLALLCVRQMRNLENDIAKMRRTQELFITLHALDCFEVTELNKLFLSEEFECIRVNYVLNAQEDQNLMNSSFVDIGVSAVRAADWKVHVIDWVPHDIDGDVRTFDSYI